MALIRAELRSGQPQPVKLLLHLAWILDTGPAAVITVREERLVRTLWVIQLLKDSTDFCNFILNPSTAGYSCEICYQTYTLVGLR